MARNPMPKAAAATVVARSGGFCERCNGQAEQLHHRMPRGRGGDRNPAIHHPSNLVHLCQPCHAWIEANRARATEQGWLIRRGVSTPVAIPVFRGGRWWLITERGMDPTNLAPPF
jgi:hypothetical protein